MPIPLRPPRGASLIEAMIALAIVMFGATGAFALQRTSNAILGDARRVTRATTYAQDLVEQIQIWAYTDPRLADDSETNNADLGDSAYLFQATEDPVGDGLADHGEADLALGAWSGLDPGLLQDNGIERFWNVAPLPDENGNGVPDGVLVMVVVRWPHQQGWRRLVLPTAKKNPADF